MSVCISHDELTRSE